MKPLWTTCRLLSRLDRFSVKPSPPVSFSTSSYLCSQKKKNSYEAVDQAKYSRLVRSVLSRGPVQTPESLFKEDDVLYGPVSKWKVPESQARVPQHWFPIFNEERKVKPHTNGSSSPLKIPLRRNVIPSVTRILQQTMPPEQSFFLERWKQRMVLELGEDGFAEYTSSNSFTSGYMWSLVFRRQSISVKRMGLKIFTEEVLSNKSSSCLLTRLILVDTSNCNLHLKKWKYRDQII